MKKRNATHSSLLILSLILLSFNSCQPKKEELKVNHEYLEEITIAQLQQGFKSGKFTIEQVVRDYLIRIEELDQKGPALNSVIYVNPEAINIAKELDKELANGKSRGPLHGIPIIIKHFCLDFVIIN